MAYGYYELCIEVLEKVKKPLSASEIWEYAKELSLISKLGNTHGKTPDRTIAAKIYTDMKKDNTKFCKISKNPVKFFLKNLEIIDHENAEKQNVTKIKYKEKDLHQLLCNFVFSDSHFKCYTKTIKHQKSKKYERGHRMWIYPDIVGIYYPFEDYNKKTITMIKSLNENSFKLFSFEMKIEINFSNLREYYFQAVSNSSWANEGYLVALNYLDEVELMDEMRKLNNVFGIGFIKLNVDDIAQSEILFSSKPKDTPDWDTINRLTEENSDFLNFVESIIDDIKTEKVRSNDFDKPLSDNELQRYIKENFFKRICIMIKKKELLWSIKIITL